MAQTIGSMTFRHVHVELSLDDSTWFDVSGSAASVGLKGGERPVLDFVPLFSDLSKMKPGAREVVQLTVKSVYTETANEVFRLLDAAYTAETGAIYLRWTPAGKNVSGAYRYRTVNAFVTKPAYPGGDVNESKPLTVEYELAAEYIEKDLIP